jgi:hypothetical protein
MVTLGAPLDVLRGGHRLRRTGAAEVVELGPLPRDELIRLLDDRADTPLPVNMADAIAERSGGNPFFAEELMDAIGNADGDLPSRSSTGSSITSIPTGRHILRPRRPGETVFGPDGPRDLRQYRALLVMCDGALIVDHPRHGLTRHR